MFHLHRVAQALAKMVGYTVYPKWLNFGEVEALRRLLRYLEVDCVFDVGANSGQYARQLRNLVEFSGTIISFELNT